MGSKFDSERHKFWTSTPPYHSDRGPPKFPSNEYRGLFPGGKRRQGRAADHSLQQQTEVGKRGPIRPRPQYIIRSVVLD
jgi:hypothetical protein